MSAVVGGLRSVDLLDYPVEHGQGEVARAVVEKLRVNRLVPDDPDLQGRQNYWQDTGHAV